MLELVWPMALLLLPLPWLVWRFWPAANSEDAALRAPFFQSWRELDEGEGAGLRRRNWLAVLLLCLTWLTLLLALARPMWIGEPVTLPASGRDLLMAVDLSGSM